MKKKKDYGFEMYASCLGIDEMFIKAKVFHIEQIVSDKMMLLNYGFSKRFVKGENRYLIEYFRNIKNPFPFKKEVRKKQIERLFGAVNYDTDVLDRIPYFMALGSKNTLKEYGIFREDFLTMNVTVLKAILKVDGVVVPSKELVDTTLIKEQLNYKNVKKAVKWVKTWKDMKKYLKNPTQA